MLLCFSGDDLRFMLPFILKFATTFVCARKERTHKNIITLFLLLLNFNMKIISFKIRISVSFQLLYLIFGQFIGLNCSECSEKDIELKLKNRK